MEDFSKSLIQKIQPLFEQAERDGEPEATAYLGMVISIIRQHEADHIVPAAKMACSEISVIAEGVPINAQVADLVLSLFYAEHERSELDNPSMLYALKKVFGTTMRESIALPRYQNGNCSDLVLVQKVADGIAKAIMAKNPSFKCDGLLDAVNASIDTVITYIEVQGSENGN